MHEQIYSGTNNFACKCYVFKLDALKQAKMPKEEEVDQVNQPTNILKASLEFLPRAAPGWPLAAVGMLMI